MAATILSTTHRAHPTNDLPFTVQDRRRKGFFTIDNELLDRFGADLGPYGLVVYMALARFANREGACWPSFTTIALRTGMSRRQVMREITKLAAQGLIAVEAQTDQATGEHKTNLYILLDVMGSDSQSPGRNSQSLGGGDHQSLGGGDTRTPEQNKKTNKTQRQQDTRQQRRPRRSQESKNPVSDENQDVVVALTDLGMSAKVASRLVERYSRARVLEKLAYLEFRQAAQPETVLRPCGWLRRAIEQDYGRPDGFLTPEEQERQTAEAERNAQEEAEQERIREETTRALEEKKKAEEEVRWQALAAQYGTTQREVDLWQQVLADLKMQLPEATFDAYVAGTQLLCMQEEQAMVGLAKPRAKDWVENRLARTIQNLLTRQLAGKRVTVQFVTLDGSAAPATGCTGQVGERREKLPVALAA